MRTLRGEAISPRPQPVYKNAMDPDIDRLVVVAVREARKILRIKRAASKSESCRCPSPPICVATSSDDSSAPPAARPFTPQEKERSTAKRECFLLQKKKRNRRSPLSHVPRKDGLGRGEERRKEDKTLQKKNYKKLFSSNYHGRGPVVYAVRGACRSVGVQCKCGSVRVRERR
ncbi:hypothetical protein LZ30DRAFT_311040 [Colletotrichum cereale]|nr:hypothetical protein LZ30DRAFT_311040 [Colletotrichum cereale]